MNIYLQELKRFLSKKSVRVFLVVGLFFTFLISFITYRSVQYDDISSGDTITYFGKEAIDHFNEDDKASEGYLTEEKITKVVKSYKEILNNENVNSRENLSEDAKKNISKFDPILRVITYPYTITTSGSLLDVNELDTEKDLNFYQSCYDALERDIKQKYDNDKITEFALEKYKEVNKPFYYGGYFSEDILFFVNIFITVLSLICILISSQCIVEDKENYLDSIFRTTRNGRNKYICSKILALASIISLYLILNISIYYGTIKYLYTNGLDSSFQMLLFNQLSISNLTIGKVILSVFLLSILFTIASSMMSIFVAINSKVSMVSSAISSVLFFIPSLLYGKTEFKSIFYFFSSLGLGTAENSLIEQYQKFEFVKLPGKILWVPKFLVIMALINIALYLLLSIKSYNKIEQ